MLEQARAGAARAGVDLDLRLGDMRDLDLTEPAALIYCPARALLHLPTWADRRRTFERVTAALAPAGRFAWNALAFNHRIAATLDGRRQKEPVPHTVHYAAGDNRIDLVRDDGATSRLWWATKNEWLGLIDVAGLRLEIWDATAEALPDDYPTLEDVQHMPAWERLRREAESALAAFARRGKLSEDQEEG